VCGISDGRLGCLGDNHAGQLGDGTRQARLEPAPVADLGDVAAVAAGRAHTCALLAAGGVSCWGANDDGQLGDGTDEERVAPTPVIGLKRVVELRASDERTCARERGGTVRCWGKGIGAKPVVQRQLRGVTGIGLFEKGICGLARGEVVCVGWKRKAARVARGKAVESIARHCFVDRDGQAACFGEQYAWGNTPEDTWLELGARRLEVDQPVRAVRVQGRSPTGPRIMVITESGALLGAKHPIGPLCRPDECAEMDPCATEEFGRGPRVWPIEEAAELEVVDAAIGARFACVVVAGGAVTCFGWTEERPVPVPPITDHWPTTVIDVAGAASTPAAVGAP
jgi:hypothetical protein